MTKIDELSERLLTRFKDVPNIDDTDVMEWVETAMNEHGFVKTDVVSPEYIPLIMLHAEADGASQIALRTAYYFEFVDKDESIDKSMISGNYRKLADSLWSRYRKKRDEGAGDIGGSRMAYMRRVDRP